MQEESKEEYTPEQREADFKEADNYGEKDEIFRSGVEVATILELVIRLQPQISLERALSNSPIRRYVKAAADDESVKKEDLVICKK